jgi:methionyl-tRNA formyltransferase
MKIVFMASPEYAISTLEALIQNKHEIVAVYTRMDKPAGRGRPPVSTPVKDAALSLNLPVVQVPGFKNPEAISQLAGFKPDAVVVAAYGQILPQAVLDIPRFGCLNIHPSLLPKYRGPSPVVSTLLEGDEFAGVSVMLLDAGMDSGPVFSSAQIPVLDLDDNMTLTLKLFQIGSGMLLEVLNFLPSGKAHPKPQNEKDVIISREISKTDGEIDWKLPARQIWRQVRAFQPWPESYTRWQGKQVKIIEAVPFDGLTDTPGKIISVSPEEKITGAAFAIETGSGTLGVIKLQSEGKKVMSADEFLRGQRNFMGALLGL